MEPINPTVTIAAAREALSFARTPATKATARRWLAEAWADWTRMATGKPCTAADVLEAAAQMNAHE